MNQKETAEALSEVLRLVDQKSEEALNDYKRSKEILGSVRKMALSANTINEGAKLEDWAMKCARAGIGVLHIDYHQAFDGEGYYGEATTVAEYEFQWRYGSGEGERRWAKSTLTFTDSKGGRLSGEGVCMLVYDRVKEIRKALEGNG